MDVDDLFDFNDVLLDEPCGQSLDFDDEVEKEEVPPSNPLILFFNCDGSTTDSIQSDSLFTKDLHDVVNHVNYILPEEVSLFNYNFDDTFYLPVEILIQMARKNIQRLESSKVDSSTRVSTAFFSYRESVTKMMLCLRCSFQQLTEDSMKTLRTAFGTFDSMENFAIIQSAASKDGNSSTSSSFHLLHGQLEWRWIYLTIIYKQEYCNGMLGCDESDFRTELGLFIYDLITLSIAKFHKCNNASIIFTSPFICSCVMKMWFAVYQLTNKLSSMSISFWNFISVLLNDIKSGKNPHENYSNKKILLRTSSKVKVKNGDQFSIWFFCGLVKLLKNDLRDNRDSFELLESLVKSCLSSEQLEENLRVLLIITSEVLFDIWTPRSEVLMLFWEIFNRKINSPFFVTGQNPNFMAVTAVSGAGYLEKIKTQQSSTTKLNPNTTSYDMFVHLLGKMVQKFTDDGQKVQVQKILGRIYTKFPASKLQTLNEMGIHNILKLFIALSISTNFEDIAKKVSDTLLQIPMDKNNQQQQLMKGHVAMLILHRENHMNITQYVTRLMPQVNAVSEKSNSSVTSFLKIIADALPEIVLHSSEDTETFENGEDLLLDSWIVKYLNGGTVAEQDRVYESLTKIIQKLRRQSTSFGSSNLHVIVQKLFKIFVPYCKQVFGKNESIWMPAMVGNLCLLAADFQHHNLNEVPKFEILFKVFLEFNIGNVENTIKFLTVVLESGEKSQHLDKLLIMQQWIKCSILLSGSNTNLKELTRCVMRIADFTDLCETSRTKPEDFLNSKEPLATFITDIGKKYSASPMQAKFQLIEKIHGYYSTFDKWALPILQLQQQLSQNQRTQNAVTTDESVMRIYMFIAITIMHCSELIYVRSKPSCFFNVAITQFLLPSSLMVGQNQPRSIIVSMYKVWPLLIEGISKLDYKNDNHIQKVLNDIIVKWAPLLKISTNSKVVAKPFIAVANLNNAEIVELVYGKLGKNFIALQNRKVSPHACMILTMIEEVLHVIEGEEKKIMSMWKELMVPVIESAMMSDENIPSQITCYNLINRFMKNKNFDASVSMKQLLMTSLQAVTQSHMSYHSAFFFRFLTKLAKLNMRTVSALMPFVMGQIKKCEQIRGSGADKKLRSLYDQLQTNLKK